MAYFTEMTTQRYLTESESAEISSYVNTQQTAGTTDGNIYSWTVNNNPDLTNVPNIRMWGTIESANGYKNLLAGFNPVIIVSVY
jgi:type IV secretory pathway component VirB8